MYSKQFGTAIPQEAADSDITGTFANEESTPTTIA
jgi:hypothetical protein